jgi:transcriptional regulator with XRE-family HTH domain
MGQKIARLRRARGLSQEALAAAAGVPVGTLRGWEYGRRTPLLDAAAKLARALGCKIDDFAPAVEIPADRPPPRKKGGKG